MSSPIPDALGDFLIVKVVVKSKTAGGVALPESAQEQPVAIVVSVGPGPIALNGNRVQSEISPGDKVWFAGRLLPIDYDGSKYYAIKQADIIARVDGDE